MKHTKRLVALLLVAVMMFMTACGGSGSEGGESKGEASGETIKIGVSYMMTGPMAAGGEKMKQAITMAFEEINEAGGVLDGQQLEAVFVDDKGTPADAVTSVQKILGSDVVAAIGPHTSPMAQAGQDLYKKAGIPFVTGATSPSLLENNNEYFFRISASDGIVGPSMVDFAVNEFGAKKICALYDTDDYGVAADNAAKARCEEKGVEYYSEGFATGVKDLTDILTKMKGEAPDVIFDFSHDAEAALIVRQLDELGMADIPHVGPNALAQAQTYELCDAAQLEGAYASTDFFADTTNEKMNTFLEAFRTRWDGEEVERYAALYYTASYLLADAINRAGSAEPAAIRDALAATQGFDSLFGELNCSEQGELNKNIYIVQFDGNKTMGVAAQVTAE